MATQTYLIEFFISQGGELAKRQKQLTWARMFLLVGTGHYNNNIQINYMWLTSSCFILIIKVHMVFVMQDLILPYEGDVFPTMNTCKLAKVVM